MALSTISGTTGITDATITSAKLADFAAAVDLNGVELILDANQDTSITADTDDQIDIKISGADDFRFTANTFTALAGSGIVVPDGGLTFGSTAISATAAEINLIDGGTSRGTTAVADADGLLHNDGGTMRMTSAATFKTYFQEGISTAYDDLTTGDAAVNIATSAGNITIDAQGNDTDIIFKGTDGGADRTFMTIDGSAGGDLFLTGGLIDLKNDGSAVSQIKFYCESSSNAHAQTLIGAPHAQSATNTLTLPSTGSNWSYYLSTVSTATVTNKTFTSPKINEDVAVTTTATEINLIDGGTSRGTTAVATGDGILINDGGTMRMTNVDTVSTYFSSHTVGGGNLVTTGALGSGSIAAGFGNIDNGASNITSGGLVRLDVDADADDISADSATGRLTLGASQDLNLYHGGTNSYIVNSTGDLILLSGASDEDMIFKGNDGGAVITALTLDMSAAGAATFNSTVTGTTFVGALTGNVTGTADVATVATTVTITDNESTNESNALIFTAGGDVDGGNIGLESDGTLTYNPSTGKVTATGFVGALTGAVTGNVAGNLTGTVATATQNSITTATGLVSVGALDSGSITSGFGAIDNGTSNIRSATITAETAFVPDASDGAALGTSSLQFSDLFLADGGIINFGDDQDVKLTHSADTGLILDVGAAVSETFTMMCTQGGTPSGPILTLYRNSASPDDNDYIGEIIFKGRNDQDQDVIYAGIAGKTVDVTDTTEDGRFEMYTIVGGSQISRILADNTETVINQDGNNLNFRVESDDDTHAFFVDATNEAVGIFEPTPAYTLEIGNSAAKGFGVNLENNTAKVYHKASATDTQTMFQFANNNGTVGTITTNGTATAYNTSSDYRLKENINYTWDATTRLKQLKPAQFSFKGDKDAAIELESGDNLTLDGTNGSSANAGSSIIYEDATHVVDGFIAHEVTGIVSEAISGDKDAVDSDGNIDVQGIDQSKLVPLLVKTIQELEARITALEA